MSRGMWLGAPSWSARVREAVGDRVAAWDVDDIGSVDGADVVVDCTRSGAEVAQAVLAAGRRPTRVVFVVGDDWLGTSGSLDDAARSAATVAACRGLALRLAAEGTTVNALAALREEDVLDDLAHALRFFLDPANAYVTGQVLSLSSGDTAWSNLSA